jgi:hypothetical protein
MTIRFSRIAARSLGPLVIGIETWRRWHQFGDVRIWPAIFDDYLAGGFLLYAASVAKPANEVTGRRYLAGAWGVAAGMMYGSFFSQLYRFAEPDPSGLPVLPVLIAKGVGLVVCVGGLLGALKGEHRGASS